MRLPKISVPTSEAELSQEREDTLSQRELLSTNAGARANEFLTAEEVSERYRSAISVGTLRNWRAAKIGPPFVKIGKAVLYPILELEAWDKRNLVRCRNPAQPTRIGG